MRILVTGGSGFIASHAAGQPPEHGNEDVINDHEPPRYPSAVQLVPGVYRDEQRPSPTLKSTEIVYHLAAEANVNRFYESPLYSDDVTAGGTLCVLEAARIAGVGRVILASTEWVYGTVPGPARQSITEDAPFAQD